MPQGVTNMIHRTTTLQRAQKFPDAASLFCDQILSLPLKIWSRLVGARQCRAHLTGDVYRLPYSMPAGESNVPAMIYCSARPQGSVTHRTTETGIEESQNITCKILTNNVRQLFQDFVSDGDGSCIGRESSLSHQQLGEFEGKVNIGTFQLTRSNRSPVSG